MVKDALKDAEKAVQFDSDDPESYRVCGTAHLHDGQPDRAIEDLTQYLKKRNRCDSDSTRPSAAFYHRGLARVEQGDLSWAVSDYTKAINEWPNWPEPYEARAEIYQRLGKGWKAEADLERAAQLRYS